MWHHVHAASHHRLGETGAGGEDDGDDNDNDNVLVSQYSEDLLQLADEVEGRISARRGSRAHPTNRRNSSKHRQGKRVARCDKIREARKAKDARKHMDYVKERAPRCKVEREVQVQVLLMCAEGHHNHKHKHKHNLDTAASPHVYDPSSTRRKPRPPEHDERIRDIDEEVQAYGGPVLSAAELEMDACTYRLLLRLQLRDITPEDYSVLTALDETVSKPKMEEKKIIKFPIATVEEDSEGGGLHCFDELGAYPLLESVCSVCFEEFRRKDSIRKLTCSHLFHVECIDAWFKRSTVCPVDRISPKTPIGSRGFDFGLTEAARVADMVAARIVRDAMACALIQRA